MTTFLRLSADSLAGESFWRYELSDTRATMVSLKNHTVVGQGAFTALPSIMDRGCPSIFCTWKTRKDYSYFLEFGHSHIRLPEYICRKICRAYRLFFSFASSFNCWWMVVFGTPRDLLQPLSGDLALPGISITYLVHSRDSRLWSFRISDPSSLRFSVLLF